jgi:hypothetical protein
MWTRASTPVLTAVPARTAVLQLCSQIRTRSRAGNAAIIRAAFAPGLLHEASLGAPGIHVRIRVRNQARTSISGKSGALASGLLSQSWRSVSAPSANTVSRIVEARGFLAGCFRHLSSSLEPVCAICDVSCRGDGGAVGIGAVLAATTAGFGSTGFFPRRRDLLRSVRVSATARYGWGAQTASAQR